MSDQLEKIRDRARKMSSKPELGDPLRNYRGKWRNILVHRDGRWFRGRVLFATEAKAKEWADREMAIVAESFIFCGWETLDGRIAYRDVSHVLQMPAGE